MVAGRDGLESALITVVVVGAIILFLWSKITGKKVSQIISELTSNG